MVFAKDAQLVAGLFFPVSGYAHKEGKGRRLLLKIRRAQQYRDL